MARASAPASSLRARAAPSPSSPGTGSPRWFPRSSPTRPARAAAAGMREPLASPSPGECRCCPGTNGVITINPGHAGGRHRREHEVLRHDQRHQRPHQVGSGTLVLSGANTHPTAAAFVPARSACQNPALGAGALTPAGWVVDYANCALSAGDHGTVTQAGGSSTAGGRSRRSEGYPWCSRATTRIPAPPHQCRRTRPRQWRHEQVRRGRRGQRRVRHQAAPPR